MVYIHSKQSQINSYIGKNLTVEQIKDTLVDMGMDIKGESKDKDPELKIEITAERMDLVSTIGIARAIKYYRGFETKLPKYKIEPAKETVYVEKTVENTIRPKTVCVILKDMELTQETLDEIIEIQEKIHDSFGRNRKKASIGIYPTDEFEFPVTLRGEKPEDIVFHALEADGEMSATQIIKKHETAKKFAHLLKGHKLFPVFRDKNNEVLSLPPLINSHKTGKVELKHKNLFIEITGENQTHLDHLLKVITTTFIEMGAKAQGVHVEYKGTKEKYSLSLDSHEDKLSLDYVNKLIGVNIKPNQVEKLLNKMMFGLKGIKGDELRVEIPCYKSDIWHDADIADDIARAYGYNNIIPRFPQIATIGETLPFSQFRDRITQTMVNLGFLEIYTYILSSTKSQFEDMCISEKDTKHIRLDDSADQGTNMCRVRILPEILTSLRINRKNKYPQKIFENGFTLQVDDSQDTGARNVAHLACAIADPKSSYTSIKAVLDTLMSQNEIKFEVKEVKLPYLIDGRAASIIVNGKQIGFIGELHPQVLENFDIYVPVGVFELNLDNLE